MNTPNIEHLSKADFENVYEPAEDTFLLLDAIEDDLPFLLKAKPIVSLEIGSGSGVIITALSKKLTNCLCLATDINLYACKTTAITAQHNQTFVDGICTNLVDNIQKNLVDLLVFNPPYVITTDEELHQVNRNDTKERLIYSWAGGLNGRRIIDQFIKRLDSILSPNGVLYLLLLRENKPDEIIEQLNAMNFNSEKFKERRIPGEYLYIVKVLRKI